MTAPSHTEFVDAFYRIAQDRANKIVILTGTVEVNSQYEIGPLSAMSPILASGVRFTDEGVQVLENIANIQVPVIAAIERDAPMYMSDLRTTPSVIVAADGATFQDVGQLLRGRCARRRNLYDLELSRGSRTSGGAFLVNPMRRSDAHIVLPISPSRLFIAAKEEAHASQITMGAGDLRPSRMIRSRSKLIGTYMAWTIVSCGSCPIG